MNTCVWPLERVELRSDCFSIAALSRYAGTLLYIAEEMAHISGLTFGVAGIVFAIFRDHEAHI
jgi:hypothetical protein